jgi:regulator of sirC expression with transglutaminase-like and TPR domain
MTTATTRAEARRLTPTQRAALVRLLDDEDVVVTAAVRQRILDCGEDALTWLAEFQLDPNPTIRKRVSALINYLGRQRADNEFLALCLNQGEDFDLERAVWTLAVTRYPEINVEGYRAMLDTYAAELGEQMPAAGAVGEEVLGCLNEHLFGELGFAGNELDYYDPENSYLNKVLDRRVGNPVSLCLVYLFVARRLRLPVTGIGMPGHFLCRYQTPTQELFIDAFNQGRLLSKSDCVKYLMQVSYGYQEGLLSPASPRRVLLRICSNLHQVYLHLKSKAETDRVQRYVVALAR